MARTFSLQVKMIPILIGIFILEYFSRSLIYSQKHLRRENLIALVLKEKNKSLFMRIDSMNRFLYSDFRNFKFFSRLKGNGNDIYLLSDEKSIPIDFYKCDKIEYINDHKKENKIQEFDDSKNPLMKLCKLSLFQNYDMNLGGLLLYGEAGSGKTFFAKKLRMIIPQNFVYIPISSIISTKIGQSEKMIEEVFISSKGMNIVFIDEVDVLISLNSGIFTTLIYELLQVLDRIRSHGILHLLIAATNLPFKIPRELIQANRLSYTYHFYKNRTFT